MLKSCSAILSCLLLAITGSRVAAAPAPATPRPNVLLIVVDDMNDWIGALHGPAHTPNIDRLAHSGMLFANAYCAVPACNPSRVAMMTGLRPETTGQYGNEGNFRTARPGNDQLLTLPQRLQQAGYVTIAAGKIFHHPRGVGASPDPLSDPISWTEQYKGPTGTGGAQAYLDAHGWAKWLKGHRRDITSDYALKSAVWGPTPQKKEQTGDWQVADYCARYLTAAHDQPFFLACGIFRPHAPLIAPQEYFDRYPLDQVALPNVPPDDMQDVPAIAQSNWSTPLVKALRAEGEWRNAVRAYLACMSFADDCVGHVLTALEASPARDNTIVILCTDNGWQLGHKNRWEKFSLWKQGEHVGLVIRAPGFSAGQCDRAVSLMDVNPTLFDLLGLPAAAGTEALSLLPWLRDPAQPRERPAIVTYEPGNHSIVSDQWNFIRYRDGSTELYDHRNDPDEFRNLLWPNRTHPIVPKLERWIPATPPADLKYHATATGG